MSLVSIAPRPDLPAPSGVFPARLAGCRIAAAGFDPRAGAAIVTVLEDAGAECLAGPAVPPGDFDAVLAWLPGFPNPTSLQNLEAALIFAVPADAGKDYDAWTRGPAADCVAYPCTGEEILRRLEVAVRGRRMLDPQAPAHASAGFFSGDASLMALCRATTEDRHPAAGSTAPAGTATVEFYRTLLDSLADGVYFTDTERRITYWNRAAEEISGYPAAEVVGRFCRDNLLVHTDTNGCQLCQTACPAAATMRDRARRQADVYLKHKNGHRVPVSVRVSPIFDAAGRVTGVVEVFSDNSSKLAALEQAAEMEQLALIDPLTSVGNRRYTERVLHQHRELFHREGESFAVLFIDIDRFKAVNDTHGHDAGDAVLRAVARTLANNLRSFDFLGRWGGEEFIAVLNRADAERAAVVAERCCALVRSCQVDWAGHTIRPTVSIGVAVVRPEETSAALTARADANLYQAKQSGRDRFVGP